MKWTLSDVAGYVVSRKAPRPLVALIHGVRRIFSFAEERSNRLARFVKVTTAYRNGMPVADIETKFGCSRNTINRYRRMAGLPKRPKHFAPEVRATVIELYKARKPVSEIRALMGVSEAYVSKVATEEGINRYAKGTRH